MTTKRQITCIACPTGCLIEVAWAGEDSTFTGYRCLKGKEFAELEVSSPRRYLTTTVPIRGGHGLLPVRTDRPVPRDRLADVVAAVRPITVSAPVRIGQVLAEDVAGTGARLIAAKSVRA